MTPYWSGSIVYEWIEEANNYGLIQYGPKVDPSSPGAPPDGFPRSGKPTPLEPEWSNLSKVWAAAKPSGVEESAYKPSLTAPECPARTSGTWEVDGSSALPTLGQSYVAQVSGTATSSGSQPTGTQAQAGSTPTGGASPGSPVKELRAMGFGLVGVLVGFFWWM
jgi:hypothetical protein